MLSVQIGKTTIHFWPLIVVVLVAVMAIIVRIVVVRKQGRDVLKLCRLGEYDKVIPKAQKLLKICEESVKIKSHNNIMVSIDTLNLILSICYLAQADNNQFLQHINAVQNRKNDKQFWISLHYLIEGQKENAQRHFELIDVCEETQSDRDFLYAIILYKNGSILESKERLRKVYPQLKYYILKDIADKIMM